MKPCLRCGVSLDEARLSVPTLTVECWCGLVYSCELVEQASDEEWLAVFREDGYRIKDDGGQTLTVTKCGGPS